MCESSKRTGFRVFFIGSSALGVSAGEKHSALLEGRHTRFAGIIIGRSEICRECRQRAVFPRYAAASSKLVHTEVGMCSFRLPVVP